jgi:hypothetical protein
MNLPEIMQYGKPMPASMGRCADLYHDVREVRLAMQKELDELKKRETEVQEHIIANLTKGEDTGAAGLRYRAQVVTKRKPKLLGTIEETGASGWDVLCSWIRKNDRFDLLQHRLNDKAAMETMEDLGRPLPGVEIINIPSLSVTKIAK